jgi:hypothetical protein
MFPIAPRYEDAILELVDALDDPQVSMAETCRRVGTAAAGLGLFRPSYSHLRRFVRTKRDEEEAARKRRAEVREVVDQVIADLATGRLPNPYVFEERLRKIGR